MLIIKPVQDKSQQKQLCERFGAVYVPDALAYSAVDDELPDGDSQIGVCQFTISGGHGAILDLICPAEDAFIIMGRAAVSFMGNIGLPDCFMKRGTVDDKLARRLGFSGDGDILKSDTAARHCGE